MVVKFTKEQLEEAIQDISEVPGLAEDLAARETIITGVSAWAGATIASATQINVTAGTGVVSDSTTDPANVSRVNVIWSADPIFTITMPTAIGFQYIFVDVTGTIQQQSTPLTPTQLRDNILLCTVEFEAGVVTEIVLTPRMLQSIGTVLNDFVDFLPDSAKLIGALIGPVTAQLQAFRNAGLFFAQGGNHFSNVKDPNIVPIPADGNASTPLLFDVILSDETIDSSAVATFPKERDVAGVPTALTGTQATIHYLFAFGTLNILQMGQTEYANASEALAAADTDLANFDFAVGIDGAILLAQIVIGNDASDFDNRAQAAILNRRLGGAVGVVTLQSAYKNSSDPEFTIDDVTGAITLQTARTLNLDPVLEFKDLANNTTLQILGNGRLLAPLNFFFEVHPTEGFHTEKNLNDQYEIEYVSTKGVRLALNADTDNVDEEHVPRIIFAGDGVTVLSIIGQIGVTGSDPDGSPYTGTIADDFLLGTLTTGTAWAIGAEDEIVARFGKALIDFLKPLNLKENQLQSDVATITDQAAIIVDGSKRHQQVTLTADRTFGLPINLVAGTEIFVKINKDGLGNHDITSFDSIFKFQGDVAVSIANGAGTYAELYLKYDGTHLSAVLTPNFTA